MKLLTVKLKSMQSELKISKEILSEASMEVEKKFRDKYMPAQEDPSPPAQVSSSLEERSPPPHRPSEKEVPPPDPDDVLESQVLKGNQDPVSKKIFRKIAIRIHPDKLAYMENSYEKEVNRRLYNKAISAFEGGDVLLLAEIALDLGLEIPEIDEHRLKLTEQKISNIKKEIKVIESTMVWHWFFCNDQPRKEEILNNLLEIMHANYTRP